MMILFEIIHDFPRCIISKLMPYINLDYSEQWLAILTTSLLGIAGMLIGPTRKSNLGLLLSSGYAFLFLKYKPVHNR